ncbi:MAG TPA: ABC transporter permease subunit [bacterium]|nr:ABC transporter permease subunit [bacterium]
MQQSSFTQLTALLKKELRIYFNSPIAYIFVVVMLGFSFWWFFRSFFLVGQTEIRTLFEILPWIYLFIIPALTMRMWSEEYRGGTIETLLTSSVPMYQLVIGKFLSSFIFLVITLVMTLPLPIVLSTLGNLDWGVVVAGYIGALLIGSAYISIGMLISSFSVNQIVSYIITALICFALYIISQSFVIYSLPSIVVPIIDFISLGSHYDSIIRGVIDTKDLIYYCSLCLLLLYTNAYVLYSKR